MFPYFSILNGYFAYIQRVFFNTLEVIINVLGENLDKESGRESDSFNVAVTSY